MDAAEWVVLATVIIGVVGYGGLFCYFMSNRKEIETGIDKAATAVGETLAGAVNKAVVKSQIRAASKTEFLMAWGSIRPGLSEEEVMGLLGPPAEVIPVEPVIWRYLCENLSGFVMFQGGRVVGYKCPEEKVSWVGRLFK